MIPFPIHYLWIKIIKTKSRVAKTKVQLYALLLCLDKAENHRVPESKEYLQFTITINIQMDLSQVDSS